MAGGIFARGASNGIFGARRARRMAEAEELERQERIGGIDIGLEDELIASSADPAEAAAWRSQFDSFKELAMSNDEVQQREGLNGLSSMATAIRGAVDRRHAAQQTFVTEQARDLRERAQKAEAPRLELQSNMRQLDALLSDPEFEQNLALNRGYLLELLKGSTRQMLSDPEDMADALIGAGGAGLIGTLVSFAGGTLAAEDFDFQKEDYARIARAMYTFNEKRYRDTMAPIEAEAGALEQAAAGLDFLPPGYSLSQYIMGTPQEFENPLKDRYGEGPSSSSSSRQPIVPTLDDVSQKGRELVDALAGQFGDAEAGAPDRASSGPQFGGVNASSVNMADRALGYDTTVRELNHQLQDLMGAGATIRADPQTGALFALYEDGRREEVPTSRLQRSFVLDGLKGSKTNVRGVIRR